jgi:hypothetical protein
MPVSISQLRKPGLKIVADVIVEVTPVDMQQVERTVGEVAQRIIESQTN